MLSEWWRGMGLTALSRSLTGMVRSGADGMTCLWIVYTAGDSLLGMSPLHLFCSSTSLPKQLEGPSYFSNQLPVISFFQSNNKWLCNVMHPSKCFVKPHSVPMHQLLTQKPNLGQQLPKAQVPEAVPKTPLPESSSTNPIKPLHRTLGNPVLLAAF